LRSKYPPPSYFPGFLKHCPFVLQPPLSPLNPPGHIAIRAGPSLPRNLTLLICLSPPPPFKRIIRNFPGTAPPFTPLSSPRLGSYNWHFLLTKFHRFRPHLLPPTPLFGAITPTPIWTFPPDGPAPPPNPWINRSTPFPPHPSLRKLPGFFFEPLQHLYPLTCLSPDPFQLAPARPLSPRCFQTPSDS